MIPLRDDDVTASRCPACAASFRRVRRQLYCSQACRQAVYRGRQPARPVPAAAPAGMTRRQASIYQCDDCDQRYEDQWCHDCNRPCRRLGYGGTCPGCDELITVEELLGQP
ncbi:MAG: hypothetical protein ACRDOK_27865 [Streptosporangiaceae bacterium]